MKIPCLLLFILFLLNSCLEKQEADKVLGHHLDDFQTCFEVSDDSFDNIRDISLGYSLSFPEYWEPQDNSRGPLNTISASRTIIDSASQDLKDAMYMMATYFNLESVDVDSFVAEILNIEENNNPRDQRLSKGRTKVFGKTCDWAIHRYRQEGLTFKMLLLFFASREKEHVIIYEYKALDTENWYNNICEMLRFKQDV